MSHKQSEHLNYELNISSSFLTSLKHVLLFFFLFNLWTTQKPLCRDCFRKWTLSNTIPTASFNVGCWIKRLDVTVLWRRSNKGFFPNRNLFTFTIGLQNAELFAIIGFPSEGEGFSNIPLLLQLLQALEVVLATEKRFLQSKLSEYFKYFFCFTRKSPTGR